MPVPTKCQLIDERGNFWLFEGSRTLGDGNLFQTYIYGYSKYQDFSFKGNAQSNGKISKSFKLAIKKAIVEHAPNEILYFQKSSSDATDRNSAATHKREAKEKSLKAMGKSKLERMVVNNILKNITTTFREGVKRGSRNGCTYFCGTSGRFVEATVFAKTKF